MIADMSDWLVLSTTIHAVSRVVACAQIRYRQLSRTDLRDANANLCWLWRRNLWKLLHSPLPRSSNHVEDDQRDMQSSCT
jgi:hypothetical protein